MTKFANGAIVAVAALALAQAARASVTVSLSAATPAPVLSVGDTDTSGASVQGDYTDNGHSSSGGFGAPGESFTTPSGASAYTLNSISVDVNVGSSGNYGNFFTTGGTWGLQVSTFDNTGSGGYGGRTDTGSTHTASYAAANAAFGPQLSSTSGTTLNDGSAPDSVQYKTLTSGAYAPNTTSGANNWVTFAFTGGDALTLLPNTTYSFDVYAGGATDGTGTSSYFDLYRAGTTLSGALAYNSYGAKENFNDDYVANEEGGNRTFVVGLTAATASTPEPTSLAAIGLATSLTFARRRRA